MLLVKKLGMQYPDKGGKNKYSYGLYECPFCKKHFKVMTNSVNSGKSTKCRSCQVSQKNTSHGMSSDSMYHRHTSMVNRCYNKNDDNYKDYGGRGVEVEDFLMHIKEYSMYVKSLPNSEEDGYTLDRTDNSGDYVRGNLRWVKWEFQNTNQRKKITCKFKYIGIYRVDTPTEQYGYRIRVKGKRIYKTGFKTQKLAAIARDSYIKDNNLQHILTGAI